MLFEIRLHLQKVGTLKNSPNSHTHTVCKSYVSNKNFLFAYVITDNNIYT